MKKVIIIGNPNTGKTTLFNSLTKSNEHTGNWHGVTVNTFEKKVIFDGEEYLFVDTPGLYSLNTYTLEEKSALDIILQNKDAIFLYIVDANSIRRNLYMAMQLKELGINFNIIINNVDYFIKNSNKFDINKLQKNLKVKCIVVDAKKVKLNKNMLKFDEKTDLDYIQQTKVYEIKSILEKHHIEEPLFNAINILENEEINLSELNSSEIFFIKNQFNGDCQKFFKNRYAYIDVSLKDSVIILSDYVYGKSKLDKLFLNKYLFFIIFLFMIFLSLYVTFFLIGPFLTNFFLKILNFTVRTPILSIIKIITSSQVVYEFFDEGVFTAGFSILSFLPQICLLYLFLSLLEDSGYLSRMAFMLDDFLYKLGLNGKSVYTMLMGFGCATTATLTAKNMSDKNAQIKTALLTPYMSCSAKLPVYSVIAGAVFGVKSIFVIFGLYLLGIIVAMILALVFEKTLLKSKKDDFLLEFPPMRKPSIKRIVYLAYFNAKQFVVRIFSIVFSVTVIIWILSNFTFSFTYTANSNNSILYILSRGLAYLFVPLGLNNGNVVTALIVGFVAKELILSSIAISNGVSSNYHSLANSVLLPTSAVFFTKASALSFLVFCLLYTPCVSNLAVLNKEIGKKYTTLGVVIQFVLAYLIAFLTYRIALCNLSFIDLCLITVIVGTIFLSIKIIINKLKNKTLFLNCGMCSNCKKCNDCEKNKNKK